MKRAALVLFVLFALSAAAEIPDIATATAKLHKIDGYIPLYWDADNGKLMMEISRFGEEMIYQTSLPAGVGSNPIGLDRSARMVTRSLASAIGPSSSRRFGGCGLHARAHGRAKAGHALASQSGGQCHGTRENG